MRTILFGDVHGCLDELKELVALLAVGPSDRLVFVGDLMDKGPHPVETVRYVRELGALMVCGNHEEKHLRWRRHEDKKRDNPDYTNPMRPLGPTYEAQNAGLSDEDVAWLNSLPTVLELAPGWLVVHGGVLPGKPLADQVGDKKTRSTMMRLRWVDENGKHVPVHYDENGKPDLVDGNHWTEVYDGRVNVVYGHEAHSLVDPKVDRQSQGTTTFGIDTGVVHGGHMTAMVLNSLEMEQGLTAPFEFVQVEAKEKYQPHPVFDAV
jgi:hypothetical protein